MYLSVGSGLMSISVKMWFLYRNMLVFLKPLIKLASARAFYKLF